MQVATILKDRNDTTKVIDLNKTRVEDLEAKGKAKEQELGQVREAMKGAQAQMEAARDEKRQVAGLLKQQMFTQSEMEREVQSLKTKFNAEVGVLEKMEPIFTTLRRLRSMALEKGLPGFRGLFLDFIDCPAQFTPCIDIAAKSRLFSFIVEDLDSAKELLKLNSQVKGGVIDIFPLSMIENN